MRVLLLALALAGQASAEGPATPEETITFTRAELSAMQDELEAMVRQRERAAFQAGQQDIRQRCASLI